jgi:hypothetical protein
MTKDIKKRDWSQYNASAKKSGAINFYISTDVAQGWMNKEKSGKPGASDVYSDLAIETCLTMRAAYNLPLRKTNGFVESVLEMMSLDLKCPDYTTMCRRGKELKIDLKKLQTRGAIDIVVDSTGVKIYGEGEWKVRQHGASKRRTWLKLHLAVNTRNLQIESFELTQSNITDGEVAPALIAAIKKPINSFGGDGAYDCESVYIAVHNAGAIPIIPPRKDAKVQNTKAAIVAKIPRDFAISHIHRHGNNEEARQLWKRESRYHARSLAETSVYRFKMHFGASLRSRSIANQCSEVAIKMNILNRIAALGTFHPNRAVSVF